MTMSKLLMIGITSIGPKVVRKKQVKIYGKLIANNSLK